MTNLENPAVTLRAAANVIRTNGFTQHAYEHDGSYCVVGALVRGAGFSDDPFDHIRAVTPEVKILAGLVGDPADDTDDDGNTPFTIVTEWNDEEGRTAFTIVTEWNDEEGRTSDDVIELLIRAADTIDPPRGPA